MESLPELVGTVHIILGPYRGNPIALYMRQEGSICQISPRIYPWNRTVGVGETPNKAAADFEAKWKQTGLADEMYHGPNWEGGIKPEKPKPPPPPKPATPPTPKSEAAVKSTGQPEVAKTAPAIQPAEPAGDPVPPDSSVS
ncbi:MAG: hypothetical protein AB7P17_04950 [Nitrospirales bacterium]|nr:hypothetical protein [Nitrospirales bacterium]